MNRQPKGSVEEIARRTGLSRSTVFRALNNCGSVDECTKAAVMTQAQAIGYIPPRARREGWTSSSLMVGVVMPANPQYFWGEAMRGMRLGAASCPEIHPVFSLYADIGRGRDALYCLEYMENLRPDLLVVTPPADPVFEKKLKALAQELPLVFFNETADAPSRFYAGADVYEDGRRLAAACAPAIRRRPRLLAVDGEALPMVRLRDEGFRSELALRASEAQWVGSVDIRMMSASTMPARLARVMQEEYADAFDTVYVAHGVIAQVCLALHKIGRLHDTCVVGYEDPRRAASHVQGARIAAYLEQDMPAQGYACMQAVHAYLTEGRLPAGGQVLAPSRLRLCEAAP